MFGSKNGLCIAVTAAMVLAMAAPTSAQSQRGGTGACCLPNGDCQQSSESGCEKDGGEWQGPGSTCPGTTPRRGDVTCVPFGPPNARCGDAIELTIGVPTDGSVDGAYDANAEICAVTTRGSSPVGVWYSVIGNGNELKATICGIDRQRDAARGGTSYLAVYCRSCAERVCLDGDARSIGSCIERGNTPEVFWCTEPGVEYLIFVALEDEPYTDFSILVEDRFLPCESDGCGPPNDECEDAIAIMTLNDPILGSTEDALSDEVPQCVPIPERGIYPNGVWYSVIGTGNNMIAEVCIPLQRGGGKGDPEPEIPFDALVQVFCGGCDELSCVSGAYGTPEACMNRGGGVGARWCSEFGREYLILVALERTNGKGGARGIPPLFLLNVQDSQQPCEAKACGLTNDDCDDAIMLNLGDEPTFGTSDGATFDDGVLDCFAGINRGLPTGVWYKVIGTGNELAVELCFPATGRGPGSEPEAGVGIFCGSCNNLQCVTGDIITLPVCADRAPIPEDNAVYWCSEEGREYYIFVESFGFEFRGDDEQFLINVRDTYNNKCDPEPCGVEQEDFCEDAQLVCPGETYYGHTFNATSDYLDHGGSFDTIFFCGMYFGVYDVWYRYTPAEDGLLFVHIEGPPTEYVFGIYDDCPGLPEDLLACNIARHHGVIVFWVNAHDTYYIRAAGTYFSRGEFEMDLVGPPCADRIPYEDQADRTHTQQVTLPGR